MKSLVKALDIVELFLNSEDELALAEIARLSGMSKATVSRIVQTLVSRGYLKQKERRGKYSLGTIYFEFSGLIKSRTRLRNIAVPHMMRLSQTAKESVMIAYYNGRNSIYTESFHETAKTGNMLRIVPDEGVSLSLYNTSLGKILLANMSENELDKYLDSKVLVPNTPNTITNKQELKKQLTQIKKDGIAYEDEEYSPGVRAIGAGIKDAEGNTVGAITVIAPSIRLDRARMKELEPVVRDYAQKISRDLGYNHTL
jgi:DNA-binding IclR family transcriptional regulator